MKTSDAKRIIKKYNRLAKVLLEYEILFHLAWKDSVEIAIRCKLPFPQPQFSSSNTLRSSVVNL